MDLHRLLFKPEVGPGVDIHNSKGQDHGLDRALDKRLIAEAAPALDEGRPVKIRTQVRNVNRSVGAMLAGEVAKRRGHTALPEDTIVIEAKGVGGQSFGAWATRGMAIHLEGVANDYVGKGLSGGRLVIYPPAAAPYVPSENILIGNTVLYGAIEGECYFSGVAGERFAVRNSGAWAVVEGVGDHGCEYMTGGCVVVLGPTGRNFAAGMSGGIAYVYDPDGAFEERCNLAAAVLEPVAATGREAGDLNDMMNHDEARLYRMVRRHRRYTGSAVAAAMLEDWDAARARFVKVMPVDYRRALTEMAAAAQGAEAHG